MCCYPRTNQSTGTSSVISPCVLTLLPCISSSKLLVQVINHLVQEVSNPAKARICDLYSTEDVTSLNSAVTIDQSSETGLRSHSFLDHFQCGGLGSPTSPD